MYFADYLKSILILVCAAILGACVSSDEEEIQKVSDKPIASDYPCFSGIYPHLAFWNKEDECGTGALAVWNDKLWAITYGPHCDKFSSDRLYEIDKNLNMTVRNESVGGTHANRLIHPESSQLFIGCYAIDTDGNVRTISREAMHGRLTGTSRSPWSPKDKIFIATMEEGLYEIDVNTLEVKTIIRDGNLSPLPPKMGEDGKPLIQPAISQLHGYHGKGFSSGYGKLFYSNNGVVNPLVASNPNIPSGALAEYKKGDADWTPIRIMQFTEIATPDGIFGNLNPDKNPIWALGFDAKSIVLMVCERDKWTSFRLPKASHSYDGSHGWNTEWPRIRDIGMQKYLMTMHGAFWQLPPSFGAQKADGIQMASNYLKVVGDFCQWQDKLVLACDDSAKKEFFNLRSLKSKNAAPEQSNSNLVFLNKEDIFSFGPKIGRGSVFLRENVKANTTSEPMFIGGFERKIMTVASNSSALELELDFFNKQIHQSLFKTTIKIEKNNTYSNFIDLDKITFGQKFSWVKVTPKSDVRNLTINFNLSDKDARGLKASEIFDGIALRDEVSTDEDQIAAEKISNAALMLPLGDDTRKVAIQAYSMAADGSAEKIGTYSFDWKASLQKDSFSEKQNTRLAETSYEPKGISFEKNSALIVEDGKRYRLPLNGNVDGLSLQNAFGFPRIAREVATERDLLNCGGIFYELPARNALGVSKIRPIASHNLDIFDFCSYRGLMLISGTNAKALEGGNPHIVVSDDKKFALWAGSIDDMWKLGKCVGVGGPWFESSVEEGEYSDPYLLGGFDKKTIKLESDSDILLTMEIDVDGTGIWLPYKSFKVDASKPFKMLLDDNCQGYWLRLKALNAAEKITATFIYE